MNSKIVFGIILTFSSTVLLSAQKPTEKKDSVVNRSVMVERDFQPTIQDAGKILSTPKEIEFQTTKTAPEYVDFTSPLNAAYSIYPLDPEVLIHKPYNIRNGFLRLGAGYPLNTLGDFMYPLVKNENNRLDFSLRHLGAFGDKTHSKTAASLQYDHFFESFSIFTGISATHDYFNYYGRFFGVENPFIMSDAASKYKDEVYKAPDNSDISLYGLSGFPLDETHWRVNAHVGVKSLPQSESINYLFDLQYNIFQSVQEQMNENHLALKGLFEVPFDDNKLGMRLEINNLQYSVYSENKFNFPKTYSLIKFNPYYRLLGDVGFLKLGVKTGISVNQGQVFTPSPDVEAQWNAIPDNLALYAGVTGDVRVNTMSAMYDENRYLSSPLRLNDLYTPIDAFAGVKFKPSYNLLIDVFGNYKAINNQYFFINRQYTNDNATDPNLKKIYQNRFDVIYARTTQSTVGLRADYNYKNKSNIYLKGAYNFWNVKDQQYAWQLPVWDIDFGANVQIMNDINISTQIFFQDGRYADLGGKAVKMTPTLDINLGGAYTYNQWLSFFVKLNNLLNRKYDIYYGYEVQGINVMAGAAFSF